MKDGDKTCWKTWNPDGRGPRGTCCCNCASHRSLWSHPWVDGKPVTHRTGWACVSSGLSTRKATLSNRHGLCELYEPRAAAKAERRLS